MLLPPSDVIADEQHDVPTTISRSANKTFEKVSFSGFLLHLSSQQKCNGGYYSSLTLTDFYGL